MSKVSKRQKANLQLVDSSKIYSAGEALDLVKKTATTKFNGSIEAHVRLGIDTKKTEQSVRGSVVLPHGTGKILKIAAFVTDAKEKAVKEAGAAIVGGDELIKKIKETGQTDFDVAVAEPAMMKNLATIAKILGQRGLMPNPKNGTVADNVAAAIKEISKGRVNFKNDESGNVHQIIGKADFDNQKLAENFKAFMTALNAAKPQSLKKSYVLGISVNATMGPGLKVKI